MKKILKNLYFQWFALCLIYFAVFSQIAIIDDKVKGGGDDYGYQVLAVNYAKGYGMMTCNVFNEENNYHFDAPIDSTFKSPNANAPKEYSFYRTPGYPIFFLGNVYKLLGCSPYVGKLAALLLLCFVAAGMPWLGQQLWARNGLLVGWIASAIQIPYTYHWCDRIVTEPLIIFSTFLLTCSFVVFQKKQNIGNGIWLGLNLAFGLMVKGSLIFIPALAFTFLLIWNLKNRQKLYHILIAILIFTACILTWSNYASEKEGKRVWLSTQTDNVMLDGNNEYSTGWWAPEWKEHKESFYNNDKMEGRSSLLRVLNFYVHQPKKLPELIVKKMMTAFIPQLFLLLLCMLWMARALDAAIKQRLMKNVLAASSILLMFFISIAHTYIMHHQDVLIQMHTAMMGNLVLLCLMVVLVVGALSLIVKHRQLLFKDIPVFFVITTANFVLLTLILFGDARFVMVMHFMFILLFCKQLIIYLENIKRINYVSSI